MEFVSLDHHLCLKLCKRGAKWDQTILFLKLFFMEIEQKFRILDQGAGFL